MSEYFLEVVLPAAFAFIFMLSVLGIVAGAGVLSYLSERDKKYKHVIHMPLEKLSNDELAFLQIRMEKEETRRHWRNRDGKNDRYKENVLDKIHQQTQFARRDDHEVIPTIPSTTTMELARHWRRAEEQETRMVGDRANGQMLLTG